MSTQSFMWPFSFFAPGNLTQPILPDWSFQRINVNYAGSPEIEREVVEKVASFGKQLGIITEAVLSLAGDETKQEKAPVKRLREIAARIEKLKQENRSAVADEARAAMERLAKLEPAAAQRLGARFANTPGPARRSKDP